MRVQKIDTTMSLATAAGIWGWKLLAAVSKCSSQRTVSNQTRPSYSRLSLAVTACTRPRSAATSFGEDTKIVTLRTRVSGMAELHHKEHGISLDILYDLATGG